MSEDPVVRDLSRDFGRSLTAVLAPAETPFYDELIDAYDAVPQVSRKDRALAFGVSPDGALALVLFEVGKIVLEGIWSAVKPMLAGIAQDSTAELRTEISKKLKVWIQSAFTKPVPVSLGRADIDKILATVKATASEQKLSDSQMAQLVETVSKALTTTA